MIVAVSDIHLGDKASNRSGFMDFIERYLKRNSEKITDLYLLGDILDFWRRDASTVISDNLEILNSICSLGFHVFYIVGNHDLIMADVNRGDPIEKALAELTRHTTNMTICASHKMTDGSRNFHFMHGHQIDYWYARAFYEAFCRAMCHADETKRTAQDFWDLVLSFLKDEPLIASRISQLPVGIRSKIRHKLAGPLEDNSMSREESAIVELGLLRQFIETGYLYALASDTDSLDATRKEIRKLAKMREEGLSQIESVRDMTRLESNGTPEETASHFLMAWSDVHQRAVESKGSGSTHMEQRQVLNRTRRIAATLTSGLQPDEFSIHGHGHHGSIDRSNSIADTGCWLGNQGSFITIKRGVVSLLRWPII